MTREEFKNGLKKACDLYHFAYSEKNNDIEIKANNYIYRFSLFGNNYVHAVVKDKTFTICAIKDELSNTDIIYDDINILNGDFILLFFGCNKMLVV